MSLIGLQKGIKGLIVMSSDLEEIFQCVYDGRVPGQWLKGNQPSTQLVDNFYKFVLITINIKFTAYPSLMPLGAWTQDLTERVNHFTTWATRIHPPVLFWLGAYTYPTGFLTAVLQANIYYSKHFNAS